MSNFINFKKSKIHFTDQGEGSVVLLLHGFLENLSMWNPFIAQLTKHHRVVCIDLLGHGQSDCIGYIHTMDDMAQAVLHVLKHLHIQSYIVIGHSMGGYVSLSLVKLKPNQIEGLCLMNSTYQSDNDERKFLRTRAIKMAQSNYDDLVRLSFTSLFSPSSRIQHKDAISGALNDALKTPQQGYMAAQEGMKLRSDSFNFLKNLSCKKLIIVGKKDEIIDEKTILNQLKSTDVKIEIYSEGHMSHIENMKEFTYSLLHFIENL